MTSRFRFDVFVSHNSKDKPRVRKLAERLRGAGLRVWYDDWQIKPGDDIYLAVEYGLEASRVQLLCLSRAALGSNWVALERSTALFRDPSNERRRFIPVLLEDCELPGTLRRFKYVDLRKENDATLEELIAACRDLEEAALTRVESRIPRLEEPTFGPGRSRISPPSPASLGPALKGTDPSLGSGSESRVSGGASIAISGRPTSAKRSGPRGVASKNARIPRRHVKSSSSKEIPEPLAVLTRKFVGHTEWVPCVAVSPDGKWVVSGAWDRTVRIWDIATSECRVRLEGHDRQVNCVAITTNRPMILSGSDDGTIRIWDVVTGRCERIVGSHSNSVRSIVPMAQGKRLLSVGDDRDGSIRIWRLGTGECMKIIRTGQAVWSVDVARDGKLALLGGSEGRLAVWDLETAKPVVAFGGRTMQSEDLVYTVKFLPGERQAVSGSEDTTVKLWDLESGACVGTLEGHQDTVKSVAVSPDGSMIASTGFTDQTVRLWDVRSATCLEVIPIQEHPFPISVTFSPDGSHLVVGTFGDILVYRLTCKRASAQAYLDRRYVNAKVVLLGESGVGKTALAYRLAENKYVRTDSTHGMNVWRLDLPLETNDGLEREALLWDLAGQEDYRLIHQLYLEETALALLLINAQKDDPLADARDWTKALRSAVTAKDSERDVAKLLVTARSDVGGLRIGRDNVEQFLRKHGFLGTISTSALTGENCSDGANGGEPSALKQLIAQHIPWEKLPWTSTPRLLADIKNAVMAMRDEADIRLLRFAELAQRLMQALPKAHFCETDVRTAVTLLANHGLVRPLKFGDLVLLRPDMLNGYAAAIIRAARAHEIGCVSEQAIYRDDFDFTGVDRLRHKADEELLKRALVQTLLDCSLCIRENEDGEWLLVFPSQYRRDRDIPGHPEVFVSYNFTGELQTVYARLVVRLWYSRTFSHKELWHNAAEFSTSRGHVAGLLMEKVGEGQARLSAFFNRQAPDELKLSFIRYVHRHLEKHGRDLERERRYFCTNPACARPFKDLEVIRELLAEGARTIVCQKCRTEVELVDHIERCLDSDPVARQVHEMDAKATQELDNQALEQILIGHMQAICGEANQIFRELTRFEYGIDGEVEFKDNDGHASGRKIYVQLKSGDSYVFRRKMGENDVFDVRNPRHLEYWLSQSIDVYLVMRDEKNTIRWMNISRYLRAQIGKPSRQIVFEGEKLDASAVWRARDAFFRPRGTLR